MSFLKNLISDLVEKRLWPVAAGLLVALVAVPVVLGGGGGGGGSATPSAPATPATGAIAAAPATGTAGEVTLATGELAPKVHPGKIRDPFVQKHLPKAAKSAVSAVSQAVAAATGAKPTPTPSAGGGVSATITPAGGGTAPKPTPTPAPKPAAKPKPKVTPVLDRWRVDLRFGQAGSLRRIDDIARLTPLPNPEYPFFVFLGVVDGKTRKAVFLISSDVTPTGDGTCRPRKSDCETIEIPEGGTEFFDRTSQYGTKQYELDVRSVTKLSVATAAKAASFHTRESAKGRNIVRAAVAGQMDFTQMYRYNPRSGVLDESKPPVDNGPSAPSGAGESAPATTTQGASLRSTSSSWTVEMLAAAAAGKPVYVPGADAPVAPAG